MGQKIKKIIFHPILQNSLVLIIAGIFIWAAYPKLKDPLSFIKQMKQYEILPHFFLHPMGHFIPALELVAGLSLFIPTIRKEAALCIIGLTLSFLGAIAYALLTNKEINCGCFGIDTPISWGKFLLDSILLLAIIIVYFGTSTNRKITNETN